MDEVFNLFFRSMGRIFLTIGLLLAFCLAAAAQDETKTYTIGVGDTIRIDVPGLFGAPQDRTVKRDGTIDLSIGGGVISVSGSTTDEVEALINDAIGWLGEARANVSVIGYVSHSVILSGKISEPGIRFLTRDAVPVYVFRAVSMPNANADAVTIRRADGARVSCRFEACEKENVLIRAGDQVEFTASVGLAKKD